MKLRVARSAVADLDEIWDYVAREQGVKAAERLVNSLTSRFSFLAKNPTANKKRESCVYSMYGTLPEMKESSSGNCGR
jgi:plasmid stabilization system protein ParE